MVKGSATNQWEQTDDWQMMLGKLAYDREKKLNWCLFNTIYKGVFQIDERPKYESQNYKLKKIQDSIL